MKGPVAQALPLVALRQQIAETHKSVQLQVVVQQHWYYMCRLYLLGSQHFSVTSVKASHLSELSEGKRVTAA